VTAFALAALLHAAPAPRYEYVRLCWQAGPVVACQWVRVQ
jgi:hypothetical protein